MSGYTITPKVDRLDVLLALSRVSPEAADAWVDRHLLGMSLAEIAVAEGIGVNGAHQRVRTANRALARHLRRRRLEAA